MNERASESRQRTRRSHLEPAGKAQRCCTNGYTKYHACIEPFERIPPVHASATVAATLLPDSSINNPPNENAAYKLSEYLQSIDKSSLSLALSLVVLRLSHS